MRACLLLLLVGCGRIGFDPDDDARAGTPSPIAWWKLDETGGNVAMDTIGIANGTLSGTPLPTWGTGHVGGAVSFTGNGDRVHIGTPPSLSNLAQLTVMAWIRPASVVSDGRDHCVFDKGLPTAGWNFQVASKRNGTIAFAALYPSSVTSVESERDSIAANVWTHVAASWDGTASTTGIVLYANGAELSPGNVEGTTATRPDDSSVAAGINCVSSSSMVGSIDDVRIYDRVLTPAQIAQLYGS